jgi:outer membrane protein TolC
MKPTHRVFCALIAWLGLFASAQSAGAASLAEVMDTADGSAAASPPCLALPETEEVPATLPSGRCAGAIVARLYLGLLRDRDRLALMRDGAAYFREWLEHLQPRLDQGGRSPAQSLMAEVERKRLQRREAEVARELRHAEAFFVRVMASDPKDFGSPAVADGALPEDETRALAALAARDDIPLEERAAAETALRLAWIDYDSAQQEAALLGEQHRIARQLLGALEQQFEYSAASFIDVRRALVGLVNTEEGLIHARVRETTLKIRILELLDRRNAVE